MYVMDYGAPVGWQHALKHPDVITGLIIQNGNAYDEGRNSGNRSRSTGPTAKRRAETSF